MLLSVAGPRCHYRSGHVARRVRVLCDYNAAACVQSDRILVA